MEKFDNASTRCRWTGNSVDPDRSSLVWVCIVCSDLSVPIIRNFLYPQCAKYVRDIYTSHSLFITSCSMFWLIKAFIKKVFLSMITSYSTFQLIKAFIKKVFLSIIERKTFLIKALISRNVEQEVMYKL